MTYAEPVADSLRAAGTLCEPTKGEPAEKDELVSALVRLLACTARALGESGQPDRAARLAAEGWALLRRQGRAPEADRLNGALHYLARLTPRPEALPDRLDVRAETPARRHQLIFDTWSSLPDGASFVLVNDHDPKPLFYQFAAEHPGEFSWDDLQNGPETWQVRIGRVTSS